MNEIKLGDKVKDIYTGFVGIAVARTEFINGCVQYSVAGKVGKDNKYPEEMGIDESSLKVVTRKKTKIVKKDTGGPSRKACSMKGF